MAIVLVRCKHVRLSGGETRKLKIIKLDVATREDVQQAVYLIRQNTNKTKNKLWAVVNNADWNRNINTVGLGR